MKKNAFVKLVLDVMDLSIAVFMMGCVMGVTLLISGWFGILEPVRVSQVGLWAFGVVCIGGACWAVSFITMLGCSLAVILKTILRPRADIKFGAKPSAGQ
jgi:hypothetical protein